MTRVEPSADSRPVGRDDVTQIVRRELFLEIFRRKIFSCLGYLVIMLVVLGFPVGLALSYVARTGFVDVPVLSEWLYQPGSPTRVVVATPIYDSQVLVRTIAARFKYDAGLNLLSGPIKESELTAMVAAALRAAPAKSLPFPVRDLQIAVDPGVVEVFLTSPHGPRDATVLIRFEPRVAGGKLDLSLKELRLGSAGVPLTPAQFLASSIAASASDALAKEMATVGQIVGVEAEAGQLKLTIVPNAR